MFVRSVSSEGEENRGEIVPSRTRAMRSIVLVSRGNKTHVPPAKGVYRFGSKLLGGTTQNGESFGVNASRGPFREPRLCPRFDNILASLFNDSQISFERVLHLLRAPPTSLYIIHSAEDGQKEPFPTVLVSSTLAKISTVFKLKFEYRNVHSGSKIPS